MPKTVAVAVPKKHRFPVAWVKEVTPPLWWRSYNYWEGKGLEEKIIDAIGEGIWSVTREGEPVKDAAYWKAEYHKHHAPCPDISWTYYGMKDKRSKAARDAKAALRHQLFCCAVSELYFYRACKAEGITGRDSYLH